MGRTIKYAVFRTRWGHFGIAGTDDALCRTYLPGPNRWRLQARLLKDLPDAQPDPSLLGVVQQLITAYFDGAYVNFGPDVEVLLEGLTAFSASVLAACRAVRFGQTTTYARLAGRVGSPNAARAVGNALARNPLPLVIPCHRVLGADGRLGGFSAAGGIAMKERMLLHERRCRGTHVSQLGGGELARNRRGRR